MLLLSEWKTIEVYETSKSCPLEIGEQWKGKTFLKIQASAMCCLGARTVFGDHSPRTFVFHTGPIQVEIRGGQVTLGHFCIY